MRLSFIFFWGTVQMAAAQNLVRNPSFEDYNYDCIWGVTGSDDIYGWTRPECSVQSGYFNRCFTPLGLTTGSLPFNEIGYTEPAEGDGYAELATYGDWWSDWNPRGYLTAVFWEPLEAGQQYCVRLKVSRCDSSSYRTSELHCFLGLDTPSVCANNDQELATYAAVTLNTEQVDTAGWTLLEGSFIANGGETTLTIGDFNVAANMDTTFIAHNYDVEFAAYYIDDVYLGVCDNAVPDGSNGEPFARVAPNPVSAGQDLLLRTQAKLGEKLSYEMVDTWGRVVRSGIVNASETRLSVAGITPGHYALRITNGTGTIMAHVVIE